MDRGNERIGLQEIIDKGLSVRMAEILVRNIQEQIKPKKGKGVGQQLDFQYQKIEDDLASRFSTRVKLNLKNARGKGAIEIPFESEDDLSRILELLDW